MSGKRIDAQKQKECKSFTAALDQQTYHVRQIALSLCVVVCEQSQHLEDRRRPEAIDAHVDLLDAELLLAGVSRLHDRLNLSVGGSHDAPQGARLLESGSQQRRVGPGVEVVQHQSRQIGRGEKRYVRIPNDQRADIPGERLSRAPDGMASATLLFLNYILHFAADGGPHVFCPVSDDRDDPRSARRAHRAYHPSCHRLAVEMHRNFGPARLHANALPGCQDNRGEALWRVLRESAH